VTTDPRRNVDPRIALGIGILLLLAGGLLLRLLVRPGPEEGLALNRAWSRLTRGEKEAAYRNLQRRLARDPDDLQFWLEAGDLLLHLDRPLEAAVHFRKAAELDTASFHLHYLLARAYDEAGHPEQAELAVRELLSRTGDHADGLYLAAALAAARGEVEVSVSHLALALSHGTGDPERYRRDPHFDPIRNDPRFVRAVHALFLPNTFVEEESS
jgi:tetratricopeptide (TPR) repeat protein